MTTEAIKPDILDGLIYVAIVLFILSVIVEKITQLVRYYPSQFQKIAIALIIGFYGMSIYSFASGDTSNDIQFCDFIILVLSNTGFLIIFFINLSSVKEAQNRFGKFAKEIALLENIQKGATISHEDKERDISFLSFIIGFVIAYLFNAHLIELFIKPGSDLGWGDVKPFIEGTFRFNRNFFGFDLYHAFGFAMTGFFLSFGSKFFHDILDTLFQAKELKRKLNDKETYQVANTQEFDKQLAMSDKDMVKTIYEKQVASLMKIDGVLGASCGTVEKNGTSTYGIKIYCNKEHVPIPALAYSMPNGNNRTIPVQVIKQDRVATICSLISPSDNAYNKTIPSIGSICFGVRDLRNSNSKYILTCYHVVKGHSHSWSYFVHKYTDEDKVVLPNNVLGEIQRGVRNWQMDAALIVPDDQWSFKNQIPEFGTKIISSRPVYFFDDDKTEVNLYGAATRQKRTGTICGVGARHKIDFGEVNGPYTMDNLIEIQNKGHTIVQQGDSGALVFTPEGEALGMVIATTAELTLAMPIHSILSSWNLELDI
jgi:hypothetical protein